MNFSQHNFYDEIIYLFLFISSVSVNKYVLSVISFTIPTVFQGWQTLVCVISLGLLNRLKYYQSEFKPLDWKTVYKLIPKCLLFTGIIVSGSKALADLPVPIFLAATNIIPAVKIIIQTDNSDEISLKVCSGIAICGTFATIIIIDPKFWSMPMPWLWVCIHVTLSICIIIYSQNVDLDISEISNIYYCNFFSIIILLPMSIYLQEAADAYNFPRLYDAEFYLGCILSGILGVFLQLLSVKMMNKDYFLNVQGFAKLFTTFLSWKLFYVIIEPVTWGLVLLNLFLATFGLNLNESKFLKYNNFNFSKIRQKINKLDVV